VPEKRDLSVSSQPRPFHQIASYRNPTAGRINIENVNVAS
jgi:hypothetical protein